MGLSKMRATSELIRKWTEALVPICNHSKSHAGQEVKWLLQHARQQARLMISENGSRNKESMILETGNSEPGLHHSEGLIVALMQSYVEQRVHERKPLQYILGTQPFMDLEILTRPPTLIPRWETEEWTARLATILSNEWHLFQADQKIQCSMSSSVQKAAVTVDCLKPGHGSGTSTSLLFNILDICTGSGCIPLGLASALPHKSCRIFGIDIHPKAVELARENEIKNRAFLKGNSVYIRQADLLAPNAVKVFMDFLDEKTDQRGPKGQQHYEPQQSKDRNVQTDQWNSTAILAHDFEPHPHLPSKMSSVARYNLIVSNPPYIAPSEHKTLEPEVALWEDAKALLADDDGLMFYPRIAHMAFELLHDRNQLHPFTPLPSEPLLDSISNNMPPTSVLAKQKELNIQSSHKQETGKGRQWRNGPDLDKVRIPELVLEIGGDHQVQSVSNAVRQAGFSRIEIWKDLANRARCIVGAR
ncbi:hypothetical protein BX616_002988 [Lobosporangium transversale]|uniref:S-adenosyl-L-methionine-dependent methyltransferase n=1 Tax=Lobosporangium transversale TaxID=64571 RepID=A0A1Y2GFP4_9FUNG|nr:S-adenosyl-L-methionine-dependent methyltransferase [Lobosporangium transversale]KAF9919019.1 hypothetical protein BX616_002988 [Lobosporangium transversale]ORZ06338.1 S-adenosyl-L-methionine-dependent methyltransferase [Lobosporangium transversale]|eukprot:XP_021877501.1 S-adenosyl-L-methionine-dependent methyltransferase [Lobosporangium transversale]